jgi:hypothetical protein
MSLRITTEDCAARSALECGRGSYCLPPVVHTEIVHVPQLLSGSCGFRTSPVGHLEMPKRKCGSCGDPTPKRFAPYHSGSFPAPPPARGLQR